MGLIKLEVNKMDRKKTFYIILLIISFITLILWMDILGSEPLPITQILFAVILFIAILYMVADAYFSYYSEKVIFAEGDEKDTNFFNVINKPAHQPTPRFARIFKYKGYTWTYSGYNAGIRTGKGNELFFSFSEMTSIIGKTLIFKGKQKRISHETFYEYIGYDKELFKQVVQGNNKLKIYAPTPLNEEETHQIMTIKGGYDFDDDRFDIVDTFIKERIGPNEMSLENLKNNIHNTLEFSERAMGDIKRNFFQVEDARGTGVKVPSIKDDREL